MQKETLSPLVSVVIPCYNTEKYIGEAISSVISQTYPNVEVIVVDDGSTDGSANIIKSFVGTGKVTYIHQDNAGVSVARNTGIKSAKGEIIALLDADDWMYPENLQEKVTCMQDARADMVFSSAMATNEKLEDQYVFKGADPTDFSNQLFIFAPPSVPSPSSVIARKEALTTAGLFDPQLSVSADLDMWIRISFDHKVSKVEKPLIKYRLVPGSMNTNVKKQIRDVKHIVAKYRSRKGLERKLKQLQRGFYYSIVGNAWHTKNFRQFVQYSFKYLQVLF